MSEGSNLFLLLGRVEGKLDAALSGVVRVENRVDALEKRVNTLETLKEKTSGTIFGFLTLGRVAWSILAIFVTLIISHLDRILP